MTATTKTGLGICGAAIVPGVLGDALLRSMPWGINVLLWIGALALISLALIRWQRIRLTGGGRWLIIPALVFAAAFAWRDSIVLQACNLLAMLSALALAAFRSQAGQVRIAGLTDYVRALVLAGTHATLGVLSLIFGDIHWRQIAPNRSSGRLIAIGSGVLIAVPLLIIFGSLFVAADAAFEKIIHDLFNWNIDELLIHLIWIGFWGWITAGFLRQMLLTKEPAVLSVAAPSLGIIEIGTALGALNLLFLVFVLVQFRYLFGGEALIRSTTGLTYAEYARRGFFELVTVAALVLPTLLGAHYLLRRENQAAQQAFRVLAGTLIALLFVIMFSALMRMRLYQIEFGLTELRLYTTAFMGWLAIVFVWFALTVLRHQRGRFAFGALMAGFAVLIGLNALNPDDFIVRVNAGRTSAETPFDASYVVGLSADAVPALIDSLPGLSDQDRCTTAARILRRWSPPTNFDWLTWNWNRGQAWQAVSVNQIYLKQIACPLLRD